MKDQNSVNDFAFLKLHHYTLKLKLIPKIFSQNICFFLNSNTACIHRGTFPHRISMCIYTEIS